MTRAELALVLLLVIALPACVGSDAPTPTPTPTPVPPLDLEEYIPTPAELPNDFLMQGIDPLTQLSFATMWPDIGEAMARTSEWGFEGGVRRVSWKNPALVSPDDRVMRSLTAFAVAYRSHDDALAAAEAHLTMMIASDGNDLQRVDTDQIGDATIAATGPVTNQGQTLDLVAVWVIEDRVVTTYMAFGSDDPLPDVLEIAADVSERVQSEAHGSKLTGADDA